MFRAYISNIEDPVDDWSEVGGSEEQELCEIGLKLIAEVKGLREGIDKVAKRMQGFAEIYFTHPVHDELADDVDGFIKDIMELIE